MIKIETMSLKGGTLKTKKRDLGLARIRLDELVISADAFEGYGESYKRRENKLITITNNADLYFEGTEQDLIDKLKNENYLIYSADAWLMNDSKELITMVNSFDKAIKVIKAEIKKYKEPKLNDNDLEALKAIGQTQGREANYIIEKTDEYEL